MGLLAQWASLIAQWQGIPTNAGNVSLIPGSEKSSGERNGNPLQYLAWEIPWTEEPGGGYSPSGCKSWTQLSD